MTHRIVAVVATVFLSLASVVTPAGSARAQSRAELAAARELFEAGLAASRDRRWEDARDAVERSLAIAERPSTLLNLAGAQAETGQLVAAAASYQRFLEISTEREARHRPGAESALRAVEARIAHVTIRVAGADSGDHAELDGSAIELDQSVPLDPGAHEVVVLRGDDEIGRRSFQVDEGDDATIDVTVRAQPRVSEVVGPSEPDPMVPEAPPSGGSDDTWVWVGVGIGAAVAIGVAVGVGVAVATSEPSYYGGNLGDGMIRF